MPRRALLRFRNPDSTQDINDRFRGLFNKGFYWNGLLTPVPGVLRVDLSPFATAGSDGMTVREDSETTRLDVLAGFKNYIVIRQKYIPNDQPVVSIESLTEPEFLADGDPGFTGPNNPDLIVFGVVNVPPGSTSTNSSMIELFEADIIDTLGRLEFRGLLESSLDLPIAGSNVNVAGDFYIVTAGSGDRPNLYAWDGLAWINITDFTGITADLDNHRQNINVDEKHLTDAQAQAAIGSFDTPSNANRFVTETDPRVLSLDEANAAAGNSTPFEDSLPSASNKFITSSKVIAAPTELAVTVGSPITYIELAPVNGPYFVGHPSDPEAVLGTVQQWFNLYDADPDSDVEYLNDDFQAVRITRVETGSISGTPSGNEVNPQVSGTTDSLGFFTNVTQSLYLILDKEVTSDVRVGYGKRTTFGTMLPHLLMSRGPKGGQIDTRILRLLFGTPNAQFDDPLVFDTGVTPGSVVSFDTNIFKFVKADPDSGLTPLGIRGNYNNVIMEGLYTATSGLFSTDFLYASKTTPGALTSTPNEWFVGRAISSTQLLVNANAIPQDPGEFIPPVAFSGSLFDPAVQPGTPVAWISANSRFEAADSNNSARLPLGIRGNNNNVIISSTYTALVGTPFISGTRYYAGGGGFAGTLVTTVNDWFIGIGISSTTIFVNANGVAIPAKWDEEHAPATGYHKFKFGNLATRNALTANSGMIFIRNDTTPSRIEYWDGAAWQLATSDRADIPAGSKMLFVQNVVPTGWTFDSSLNSIVVTITSTLASGGTTSGSWFVSGFQADGHSLSVSEMPAHSHAVQEYAGTNSSGSHIVAGVSGAQSGLQTGVTGSSAAHLHTVSNDGAWRPYNVATIMCTKN